MPAQMLPILALTLPLLAMLGLIGFVVWRARKVDQKLDLLFKAAAVHTREMRKSMEISKEGFSEMRQSENHRRVLIASLSSQMRQINDMVYQAQAPLARQAKSGNGLRDRYERAFAETDPAAEQKSESRKEAKTGGERGVAGYRPSPKREQRPAAQVGAPQAAQQRKAKQIEEFFRKVAPLRQGSANDAEVRKVANG